jgi:hypothetical protein
MAVHKKSRNISGFFIVGGVCILLFQCARKDRIGSLDDSGLSEEQGLCLPEKFGELRSDIIL